MSPEDTRGPEDEKLSEIAARLRQVEEAPGLWDRIEQDLAGHRERTPLELHRMHRRRTFRNLTVLAAAVLLVCTLLFIVQRGEKQRKSLLMEEDEAALAEMETARIERELARLEPLFLKEMTGRREEAALFAGHLEILDANIETCRKAWEGNRLNRCVQRSLLRGYRKKLELLQDFISARG